MRVNLIAWDNGVGLSRDLRLIQRTLQRSGMVVTLQPARGRGKLRKWFGPWVRRVKTWWGLVRNGRYGFDINLQLEHLKPEFLPLAGRNMFIPNPEWCLPSDVKLLQKMDRVLVKTRHAVEIFQQLGCDVKYIGFTSEDRYDGGAVPRQRTFFHLAGRSSAKQTDVLLETWLRHPEWPLLTVIQHPSKAKALAPVHNIHHRIDYIDDTELLQLQNEHLFHICPSETEGFGHYIMEGLSVGAIVLATDAEPMNELVSNERGILIQHVATRPQNLATCYLVDGAVIERAVAEALALPEEEIVKRSAAARAFFKRSDEAFASRMGQAVSDAGQIAPARRAFLNLFGRNV
ncbi:MULTISPECIES: glycosyltransferase [unclassified Pseudoxanthomonas]|uniref:glycosyltransferase n=1 Tax=unclassified Pseudoxanthomonas TaxID=2645906 RepID=UPI00160E2F4D|nr:MULTISPECIES: glycosyltransferase [unclassified Pseudoxanthomonas]MBB3275972.1 glycosyltransferase involved in cell wall biosynthesis [Pseudoxanthomonas sp. OG2]MBD9379407.1 glycosyltransferase [Pseudoxanthomonas sp. PXM04]MBV7472947.1 glycosyltransferase [Pseudoxanthomonas sp. PXM05]